MTCFLKIAAKLTHPFPQAALLWPDNPTTTTTTPRNESLHPVIKCTLLPLYIPLGGMSQLPCKLESEAESLFSAKQRRLTNRSGGASSQWLAGLIDWAAGGKVLLVLCRRSERLKAQSLYSLSSFISFCCDYVHVRRFMCPCVGPRAVVRQVTGAVVS